MTAAPANAVILSEGRIVPPAAGRPAVGITRLEHSADPDGLGEPCSGA